jgi:hypothetical protein
MGDSYEKALNGYVCEVSMILTREPRWWTRCVQSACNGFMYVENTIGKDRL